MQDLNLQEAQQAKEPKRKSGDLSVSQVAREMHIRRDVVIKFLKSGELTGYDVTAPGARKKSYRITRKAVDEFKERKTAKEPERVPQSRRRAAPVAVREFF